MLVWLSGMDILVDPEADHDTEGDRELLKRHKSTTNFTVVDL